MLITADDALSVYHYKTWNNCKRPRCKPIAVRDRATLLGVTSGTSRDPSKLITHYLSVFKITNAKIK